MNKKVKRYSVKDDREKRNTRICSLYTDMCDELENVPLISSIAHRVKVSEATVRRVLQANGLLKNSYMVKGVKVL